MTKTSVLSKEATQAFLLPRAWARKIEKIKFLIMYANATVLYENTTRISVATKFDHVLGFTCY
jgi:hypothetical protein